MLLRKTRSAIFLLLAKTKISDKLFYTIIYFLYHRKFINWKNPTGFNEKLMFLKQYGRFSYQTKLSDKLYVRKFLESQGYAKYLVPIICVFEPKEDINIGSLPKKFVIKATNDSGSTKVILETDSEKQIEEKIQSVKLNAKTNYYQKRREWHYKDIEGKIIVEELLQDEEENLPYDIKCYCFSGKIQFIHCVDPTHQFGNLYSKEWKQLPYGYKTKPTEFNIKKPSCLTELIEVVERLASKHEFVRMDFYVVKEKLYFGEYTFFPNGGLAPFYPKEQDKVYGKIINVKRYLENHDIQH